MSLMRPARGAAREVLIPAWKRSSIHLGLAFGALGLAIAGYLILVVFHYQDRHPAFRVTAPGFGAPFRVVELGDSVAAFVTITSGERNNQRAAGGDDAAHDYVRLMLNVEAVQSFSMSSSDWHARSGGAELSSPFLSLEPFGLLSPGARATGSLLIYGIPAGAAAILEYQTVFDDSPQARFEIP